MLGLSLSLVGACLLEILLPSSSCQSVVMGSSTLDATAQPLPRTARSKAATTLDAPCLRRHRIVSHGAAFGTATTATTGSIAAAATIRRSAGFAGSTHRRNVAPELTAAYGAPQTAGAQGVRQAACRRAGLEISTQARCRTAAEGAA